MPTPTPQDFAKQSQTGKPPPPEKPESEKPERDEDALDEALDETFPASDPIAPQDPGRPGQGRASP